MITLDRDRATLSPVAAYGLDTLLDLARLVPAGGPHPRLPSLRIVDARGDLGPDPALVSAPIRAADGTITLTTATLAAIGRLAGAAAEQGTTAQDRYGRVPASANALGRDQLWQRPVVSQAARQLRAAAIATAPDRGALRFVAPWPEGRRWAAALTHDLDLVAGWGFATALRVLELLRHGAPVRAARALGSATTSIGRQPVEASIARLLEHLAAAGIRGTWFILCGTPTLASWRRGDLTYHPESDRVRRLLLRVRDAGHELGLHGSFATQLDPQLLAQQRARLEGIIERPVCGVRQHFLRMRPGATQRAMLEAGFDYDATYGFADRSGYRLATADVVPAWDQAAERVLPLAEVPLHWMDRTLSKYAGIESPEAWVADGLERASEAEGVEGLWVGLWHPNLTSALGFPGAEPAFAELVTGLSNRRPWFGTVGDIVRWRRARSTVRAVRLAPDGSAAFTGADWVPIEDADGVPVRVERVAA